MMIWLQKGHMFGSMAHRHILIGDQENLIILITRIVHILVPAMNGMMRTVLMVMDIHAKQIYIEHVRLVLVVKLHY